MGLLWLKCFIPIITLKLLIEISPSIITTIRLLLLRVKEDYWRTYCSDLHRAHRTAKIALGLEDVHGNQSAAAATKFVTK